MPIVTLSTKNNVNLTKQLSNGFKGSVYWENYQTIPEKVTKEGTKIYELLRASFQGVESLSVLAYVIAAGAANYETGIKDNRKHFLAKGKIKSYHVLIDGRSFYDQEINDLIKQHDEVRKTSTREGDDYITGSGCSLDYAYFKENYRLIVVNLSKQDALDVDLRAIQQIVFRRVSEGGDNTKIRLYTILEKSKETVLEFYKPAARVL